MAKTKSAKKAIRKIKTRTLRNYKQKREMKDIIKDVINLAEDGKKSDAEKKISTAYKKIDKAAKNHIIHKNTAARYKSRLARTVANSKAPKKTKKKSTKKKTRKGKKKK